ncbi:uncharacterized protein [Asterias amurensis]|uniref:uncharacterized protein n=1 Tax=Asterias amurensis TaxID=7602 RepID=UPI003AB4A556
MVTPTPYDAGFSLVFWSCFRSNTDTKVDLSFGRHFVIAIQRSSIQTDTTTFPDGSGNVSSILTICFDTVSDYVFSAVVVVVVYSAYIGEYGFINLVHSKTQETLLYKKVSMYKIHYIVLKKIHVSLKHCDVMFTTAGNAVHLTMATNAPYLGRYSPSLSCFRSSPDTSVHLRFGRPFMIGIPGSSIETSINPPAGSTYTTLYEVTRMLPDNYYSTGLYYCEGSNSGWTTRVYGIIHSEARRFAPTDGWVTKTVNKGEDVTLSIGSVNGLGTFPLWRRIRNGVVDNLSSVSGQNTLTITLSSVDVMHGDLFAVIQSDVTTRDNHFGMIRLIVRGCFAGQWGPPACTGICDQCYNGGVCDDETGQCICAPGFSGTNCLTACGMHRFGWNCEFHCALDQAIFQCDGSQFGLPDPYGSSCISGYSGRDCNIDCTAGKFGAGCTQTCHCQSGGTCDIYTGVCSSGCATGWYGVNCQESNINGCPDSVILSTALGATRLPYTWDEPTATDASGQPITNITKTHEPGASFTLGTTTQVTYTFTNSSGNIETCTFTVTVSGITAFQTFKTNPGQDVEFSCAATSGETLSADSLYLIPLGNTTVQYKNTSSEGNVINNTFIVPRLQENQQVVCFLNHLGKTSTTSNTVSFFVLPSFSQQPMLTPESTSVSVIWNAWNSSPMDSGDGPIVSYKVYYSPGSSSPWIEAGTVPVTDQSKVTFIYVVQPLEANTSYRFSVAAVREGQGGEGPMSPESSIQTLPPPPAPSTTALTTVSPSGGSSTIIVIICVIVVVVILVIGCLAYFLRVRMRSLLHSMPQEPTQDQAMTGYENKLTSNASATDNELVG